MSEEKISTPAAGRELRSQCCGALVRADYRFCPHCGYECRVYDRRHDSAAASVEGREQALRDSIGGYVDRLTLQSSTAAKVIATDLIALLNAYDRAHPEEAGAAPAKVCSVCRQPWGTCTCAFNSAVPLAGAAPASASLERQVIDALLVERADELDKASCDRCESNWTRHT